MHGFKIEAQLWRKEDKNNIKNEHDGWAGDKVWGNWRQKVVSWVNFSNKKLD